MTYKREQNVVGWSRNVFTDPGFIPDDPYTFVERNPLVDMDESWDIATDSEGLNLMASGDNRLYTSDDSGATWTERQPAGDVNRSWRTLASDGDGSVLVAGASSGRLYTSDDSGVTWTERQPNGDADFHWSDAASDSDGSVLMVVMDVSGGGSTKLFVSVNSGVNWTEREPKGSPETFRSMYVDCSNSSGGVNMIAAYAGEGEFSGRVWTSDDTGATWSEVRPNGDTGFAWRTAAIDDDGSNLIVAEFIGSLWTSDDRGVTWFEARPGNGRWISVASDSDGSTLVAVVSAVLPGNNKVFYSIDGITWDDVSMPPSVAVNRYMREVVCDADGTNLFASARPGSGAEGGIFTAVLAGCPDEWAGYLSVAVIPGDGEDEVWVIARRCIDFQPVKYIEQMQPRQWTDANDAFYVDSGLTFDGGDAIAITNITQASPGVVTAYPHGFSDGDQVLITGVVGMTELNDRVFSVGAVTGTALFELRDASDSVDWDTTIATAYTSGGSVRQVENRFTTLSHLEGETVAIVGDGGFYGTAEVESGTIVLTEYFNVVHAGLAFTSTLVTMRLDLPGQLLQGRAKRINEITIRFFETRAAKFGWSATQLDPVVFRDADDPLEAATPLFSGDMREQFGADFGTEARIWIVAEDPLPFTVTAIIPFFEVYE